MIKENHAIHSDPSDYTQDVPYIEGIAPFFTSSQYWLCVAPLTAFPKSCESLLRYRGKQKRIQLFIWPSSNALPGFLVLSQILPHVSCCLSETSHCPGHLLGGFYPILYYAVFHPAQTFSKLQMYTFVILFQTLKDKPGSYVPWNVLI